MKMTLMGTGTSHGIPVVGCTCRVCTSSDEKDTRLRCSAYIENPGNTDCDDRGNPFETSNIIIDIGPEFRIQALKNKIRRVDGVLLTHSHADHCHGLDDLRIFSFRKVSPVPVEGHKPITGMSENDAIAMAASKSSVRETKGDGLPIYANSSTIESIIFRFAYIFNRMAVGGGIPKLSLKVADEYTGENPIVIGSIEAIPVPMIHGTMVDYGWVLRSKGADGKFSSIAYLTDCNYISDESIELVKNCGGNLEHLVIDALRATEHPTHCNFERALFYADRIGAKHTWFTHICHDNSHNDVQQYIDDHIEEYGHLSEIVGKGGSVRPAYDGLVLETN